MKLVGFVRELLAPFKAAPGEVREMTDEDYEELRKQAKEGFLVNLTTKPTFPLMWVSLPAKPQTVIVLVPCSQCMGRDLRGDWICTKPMTKCLACDDTRTEIAARAHVGAEFQKAFAENIRRVCK